MVQVRRCHDARGTTERLPVTNHHYSRRTFCTGNATAPRLGRTVPSRCVRFPPPCVILSQLGESLLGEKEDGSKAQWVDLVRDGVGDDPLDPARMSRGFKHMSEQLFELLQKVPSLPEFPRVMWTKFFLGATAWYRSLADGDQALANHFLDSLVLNLDARLAELKIKCKAEWGVVEGLDEAMWEGKATSYALRHSRMDAPICLCSGGKGSTQLSGLDGFQSFLINLPKGTQLIANASGEGSIDAVTAAAREWAEIIRATISDSMLRKQLNFLAARSQEDSSEPVRMVLTSGFWYLGVASGLVKSKTPSSNYAYQPLEVVLDAVCKMREQTMAQIAETAPTGHGVNKKAQQTMAENIANAVRFETLIEGLFDELYIGGVECMFVRNFQFQAGPDGKLPEPGKNDDFRCTWTAGTVFSTYRTHRAFASSSFSALAAVQNAACACSAALCSPRTHVAAPFLRVLCRHVGWWLDQLVRLFQADVDDR